MVLSIAVVLVGGICLYVLVNRKISQLEVSISKIETKVDDCINKVDNANTDLDMSKVHKGHLKIDGFISCTGDITGYSQEVK